ncbi:MAG: OmpA family protein [Bacteroidota bacterium]
MKTITKPRIMHFKPRTINFKNYLQCILFLCFSVANSQSYIGYSTDNYNGVHGVLSNPANIVDSRLKLDVNLVGVSAFFGNDYIGFNVSDAFNDVSTTFDEADKSPMESNNLSLNLDVLGPAVLLTLNETNALSFYIRGRLFFNASDINGETLEREGGFDETQDFFINEGNLSGATNLWAELGISYARVLLNKEQHFLKGGITIKYLQGAGNVHVFGEDIGIDYDSNTREVNTSGEITYGNTDELDEIGSAGDFFEFNSGRGIGTDVGLIYEWRPHFNDYSAVDKNGNSISNRGVNKYKLKLGISVTDIGTISNTGGITDVYDLNQTQNIDNFDGDELEGAIEDNFVLLSSSQSPKSTLPTALHFNTDWNLNSKFYLNLNTSLPLTSKTKINTNRILSQFSLTPRFETTLLSIYFPISLLEGAGVQWGTGLRFGPLYLGSGSVLSSILLGNSTKSIDLYAGLKIPIYQGRLRDKDKDGLQDKDDVCPEVAGPIENNGCPWKDNDGDDILDKDDQCPNEIGPQENEGCPWEDADGDGILDKDDECPETPGIVEHKGCPDTDGDGLIDKNDRCPKDSGSIENKGCPDIDNDTLVDIDDACPKVVGPISNNGCPEVTEEVQKQLNDYARTILFDTGKATIKTESVTTMVDIIQILNEYPSANFTVEGHTDSVGSSTTNQRLSESRANAVRDFLINEGIAPSRLIAKGYGEEKPIASNTTKSGRKQNRRVEINLIK